MTFRTRLFLTSLAAAALTLLVATTLVSWSVRRTMDGADRAVAGQRGAAGRRNAVASPRRDARRSSTPRRTRSAGSVGRAGHVRRRRTARSSATPSSTPTQLRDASRTTPAGRRSQQARARGPRHRAALQHHARRPTCSTSRCRCATPTRRCSAASGSRCRSPSIGTQLAAVRRIALVAFGAGLLAALGARLGCVGAAEPARARDRRGGRALRGRRLVAAGARLRQRRDRHRRARADDSVARDRPPGGRPRVRSRPHGSHPRRHDRRRARRQRARPACSS